MSDFWQNAFPVLLTLPFKKILQTSSIAWCCFFSCAFALVKMFGIHKHYKEKVRLLKFNDTTPLTVGGRFYVHTYLKKNTSVENSNKLIEDLKFACDNAGGKVTYVGLSNVAVIGSSQVPDIVEKKAGETDFVILSHWESKECFLKFRQDFFSNNDDWVKEFSQGMKRKTALNYLIPQGLGILKLTSAKIDISTPKVIHPEDSKEIIEKLENIESLVKTIEELGDAEDPIIIWNWIKNSENKQDLKADQKYGLKMMKMLSKNGGGILHVGSAESLSEKDGNFDTVAGVHYPDRKFLTTLLRSEWMFNNLEGKKLADTLAVVTVPYK